MRTTNELKKISRSDLRQGIYLDTVLTKVERIEELNAQYLERHPEIESVPNHVLECNKEMALHYTLGSLQASLYLAISDLQTAEAALEAVSKEVKSMLINHS